MTIFALYRSLLTTAKRDFSDVVVDGSIPTLPTGDPLKLRILIADGSLLDIYLSASGRYSYHWERRLIGLGTIYRHDNAPHDKWRHVTTFPKHFHDGSESNVVESYISSEPEVAIQTVLAYIRAKLLNE